MQRRSRPLFEMTIFMERRLRDTTASERSLALRILMIKSVAENEWLLLLYV